MKKQLQAHHVSFKKITLNLFVLLNVMTYIIELRKEVAARLKKARENNGFNNIESFCEAHKISYAEYLSYETGSKPLKLSQAKIYARLLNISVQWLIIGR